MPPVNIELLLPQRERHSFLLDEIASLKLDFRLKLLGALGLNVSRYLQLRITSTQASSISDERQTVLSDGQAGKYGLDAYRFASVMDSCLRVVSAGPYMASITE